MSGFILVKRDMHLRDLGVFTGSMVLVESTYELWKGHYLVKGEADISEHIDRAYIFPGSWQAWRWADRMMHDPSFKIQTVESMSWDVRTPDDFHLGEIRPWGRIHRHDERSYLTLGGGRVA